MGSGIKRPQAPQGDVTDLLRAAIEHHQAGRADQAERLYREVLEREPGHSEALHLSGVIALGARDFDAAVRLIGQAIEADPTQCFYHANLGVALMERGETAAAVAALQEATRLEPRYAEAHGNLGTALQSLGRFDEALGAYDRALALQPGYLQAAYNRGNALRELGRWQEAVAAYDRVLQSNPEMAEAHYNRGVVLRHLTRLDAAADSFARAVAANPSHATAHYSLGLISAEKGMLEAAVAAYRRALELTPDTAEVLNSLGNALRTLGQAEAAIGCFERILEVDPAFLRAYDRLQEINLELNRPRAVMEVVARVRRRLPDNQMSIVNEAFAHLSEGRHDDFAYLYEMDCVPHTTRLEPPPPFASIEDFNAALAEEVLGHPSLEGKRDEYDTSARAFAYGLQDQPSELIERFEGLVLAALGRFAKALTADPGHPFLGAIPERFKIKLWATVLNSGGYHQPHNHEHAWLSGVYYAKVPRSTRDGGAEAGWIKFDGFTRYPHLAAFRDKVRLIEPKPGLLVLFPSYFLHETVPFTGEDTRISLAFDVAAG